MVAEIAFKIAASMAFKDATGKASPVILEPIMAVEVVVPEEFSGSVFGDLNGIAHPLPVKLSWIALASVFGVLALLLAAAARLCRSNLRNFFLRSVLNEAV